MKNILSATLLAFLLFTAASCKKVRGDGPTVTETRSHSDFTAISSGIPAEVEYRTAPDYSVEISAQQNILDKIRSEVHGGELRFEFRSPYNFGPHDPIKVRISGPDVTGFTVDGSGSIEAGEVVRTGKTVRLKVNGSGDIHFESVEASGVDAEVVGSGKVTVADGDVATASADISGSGDIDLRDLSSEDADARISGSGKIYLKASRKLDVDISGSGKVYYRGNPTVTTNISGSGSVSGI
jgi:hypothetical protein